jgi:hypothetical protein
MAVRRESGPLREEEDEALVHPFRVLALAVLPLGLQQEDTAVPVAADLLLDVLDRGVGDAGVLDDERHPDG